LKAISRRNGFLFVIIAFFELDEALLN
jgi:hypothetical protein